MKTNKTAFGFVLATFAMLRGASASTIVTNLNPGWTRPTSNSQAAATLTTYAAWNGFATVAATNNPTAAAFSGITTSAPTAGDSSYASSGSFIISNTTATDTTYYPTTTSIGDIYAFSAVPIAPQVIIPEYNIAGNKLNVLVQAESDGSVINTGLLTTNGVQASTLPNYSVTETYTDGGSATGFGEAYRNDYAWSFTLPADTSSLQLNFGWGASSAALTSLVVDTQSVAVPEPASAGMLLSSAAIFLMRRRNVIRI